MQREHFQFVQPRFYSIRQIFACGHVVGAAITIGTILCLETNVGAISGGALPSGHSGGPCGPCHGQGHTQAGQEGLAEEGKVANREKLPSASQHHDKRIKIVLLECSDFWPC